MKLSKLIIKNFRGLKGEKNEINFSDSNILFLIGQNNVGKSTYLKAYEFFTKSNQSATSEDFYNHSLDNPIIIEGWFTKDEEDNENVDFIGSGKSADPDWINKWVDSNNIVKIRKTWDTVGNSTKQTLNPNSNEWQKGGFGGLDTLFTKYSPTPIFINAMETESTLEEKVNKLIQDDFIKKMRLEHTVLCDEITAKIGELQSKITNSDAVTKLNDGLNENFSKIFSDLTLKIQATKEENIKIEDAFKKNHTITVEKINSERKESFLQNGHGVIRQALFNFLAFLKENRIGNKKEYIILFEEPELFLHPKIAFKLRQSLYELAENSPYQIICATHSPLMIDISKPHSSLIKITKRQDETTETYQVGYEIFGKDEEQKQRIQMINRFNPHICEAFYSDKVLLVEGDTETIVYRELLKNYYPNEEIFVLNTGSKNNIPFFQDILTAFNTEHFIIHDGDTPKNKNGGVNSAWTLNQKIWDKVELANKQTPNLCRRYVHIKNFEDAHSIDLTSGKDKPLEAYKFILKAIKENSQIDCKKWLNDIIGNRQINHTQEYINTNTKD
jgi:predicted ATP-dependent endonuclease of OLD family